MGIALENPILSFLQIITQRAFSPLGPHRSPLATLLLLHTPPFPPFPEAREKWGGIFITGKGPHLVTFPSSPHPHKQDMAILGHDRVGLKWERHRDRRVILVVRQLARWVMMVLQCGWGRTTLPRFHLSVCAVAFTKRRGFKCCLNSKSSFIKGPLSAPCPFHGPARGGMHSSQREPPSVLYHAWKPPPNPFVPDADQILKANNDKRQVNWILQSHFLLRYGENNEGEHVIPEPFPYVYAVRFLL